MKRVKLNHKISYDAADASPRNIVECIKELQDICETGAFPEQKIQSTYDIQVSKAEFDKKLNEIQTDYKTKYDTLKQQYEQLMRDFLNVKSEYMKQTIDAFKESPILNDILQGKIDEFFKEKAATYSLPD